jgi:hypothetical protein
MLAFFVTKREVAFPVRSSAKNHTRKKSNVISVWFSDIEKPTRPRGLSQAADDYRCVWKTIPPHEARMCQREGESSEGNLLSLEVGE